MSEHDVIPLTRQAMQEVAGPEFDADSRAIGDWLADGPEPPFREIGERLLTLHHILHKRGWYTPDDFVARAVAELEAAMKGPDGPHSPLKGAVARLVELTREIVHDDRPPPPGGSGPVAGQMALGRAR